MPRHRFIDITGEKFGRLIVERYSHTSKWREAMWDCRCDCGNTTVASGASLRAGCWKSCGCVREEKVLENMLTRNPRARRKANGVTTPVRGQSEGTCQGIVQVGKLRHWAAKNVPGSGV